MKRAFFPALLTVFMISALFASNADVLRYFNSGKSSYSDGAYSIAVNFFEKALALDPESDLADDASYYIGMCYFQDGKYETAIQSFARFVNNYPDSLFREKVLFTTGNCYYKLKNYEKAIQNLRGFMKVFPDSKLVPNAHFLVAYSLLLNNKFDSASEEFSLIFQKFPASPFAEESRYRAGQAMVYDKDYANGVIALGEFITKYPASPFRPEALFFLGKAYYQSGKYEEAVRSLAAAPDNISEKPGFQFRSDALYYLSMAFVRLDNYPSAVENLQKLVLTNNEYREEGLYKLGLLQKMNDRIDDAAASFKKAAADYPGSEYTSRALQELAACSILKNDYDSALQAYNQISLLGGENVPLSMLKKGELKFLMKDYRGAISVLDGLIEKFVDTDYGKTALYWKARCYLELKDYRSAITGFENYNKSEPLSPRADEIDLFIGNAYSGLGDYASALVAYNAVLQVPGSAYSDDAVLAIAWVYAKKEEFVRAIETYDQLTKNYPKSDLLPQAYYSVGIIRYNLKQYPQALDNLKKVYTLYRDSSYAGDAVVKIAWIYYKQENFETLDGFISGLDLQGQNFSADQKADIYNLSGLARFRLNRYSQAIDSFGKSLELTSGREKALENLLYIAKSYYNSGDYKTSITAYRSFIDRSRSYGINSEIPSALAETAWCYLQLGDKTRAETTYRDLGDSYPQSSYTHQAYYKLGEYDFNLGDFTTAVSNYSRVVRLAPGTDIAASATYWTGWSYLNLSNKISAVNAFEKYSDQSPKGDYAADAFWRTANLYYELNNYPKAKIYLNKLTAAFPRSENIGKAKDMLAEISIREQSGGSDEKYYQLLIQKSKDGNSRLNAVIQLALVYKRKGKTDDAVKQLKTVIQADSKDLGARASLELAEVYKDGEKYLDAVRLFGNTISVYKTAALYPQALYGLSYCYYKLGNRETARKYLKNINDKYPGTEWSKKADELEAEMVRTFVPRDY